MRRPRAKRLSIAIALIAAALAIAAPGRSEETPVDELVRRVLDPEARAELIWIGPPAVPALLARVAEGGGRAADEAAGTVRWIVWQWRDEPAARAFLVETLGGFLGDPAAAAQRSFAVDALADLGPDAVPTLSWALTVPALAPTAVLALERVPGEAARRALIEALDRGDLPAEPLLTALGRRAEPPSVDRLIAAAEGGAVAAYPALAQYDGGEARRWLLEEAASGSNEAFEALVGAPDHLDGATLAALLESATSLDRRERILREIERPRQHDDELAARLLAEETPLREDPPRLAALLALGPALEPASAERVARAALERPVDARLTPSALWLCAARCDPSAASLMGPALGSDDLTVRQAAVEALAAMEGGAASVELRLALERESDQETPGPMAEALVGALGRRSDEGAVRAVEDLLRTAPEALEEAVLAATAEMAPRLAAPTARRLWRASLERRPTPGAIEGLAAVGEAPDVELLGAVHSRATGKVREAALASLIEIGRRLAGSAAPETGVRETGDRDAAVAALTRAFEAGAPVGPELRDLGERVELVAHGGRIDAWWQTTVDGVECERATPPADRLAALDAEPTDTGRWTPREASGARGTVTLPPSPADAIHWLAVDLSPRLETAAGLDVLATAPVAVWLDGEALSALPPTRGQGDNEQRFAVRLAEGSSRLLVRLCGTPTPFVLGAQLRDDAGRALKFGLR